MSNWLSRVQEVASCLKDCAKGKVPPKHVLKRHADRLEKYVDYKMNAGAPTMSKRERIEQPKTGHEAGELPRVTFPTGEGVLIVESPDVNGIVIVRDDSGEYRRVNADSVKPIKAERERVIEAANKVCTGLEFATDPSPMEMIIFSKLYDAGMLKLPE